MFINSNSTYQRFWSYCVKNIFYGRLLSTPKSIEALYKLGEYLDFQHLNLLQKVESTSSCMNMKIKSTCPFIHTQFQKNTCLSVMKLSCKSQKKNIYIHKPIVHFIFKSEIQSRMNYQTHTFRLV